MDLNIMEELADQVYKRSTANDSKKQHKVQKLFGKYFIPLSPDLQISENTWYTQELQPNGDVLLRKRTPEQ